MDEIVEVKKQVLGWETPRVLVRHFVDDDLEAFYTYRNDEAVARFQGWDYPYSRERATEFIAEMKEVAIGKRGEWVQLAMQMKSTGELIGDVAFYILESDDRQAEMGITLASRYQGQRIAPEVVRGLLNYLFSELGLHRVRATCDVDNAASVKVLEGLGLRREAHFIENVYSRGQWKSEYVYAILEREWFARH